MPLLLTRQDVESILTMRIAIDAVEEAFRQFGLGNVTMPQRAALRLPGHRGFYRSVPVYLEGKAGGLGTQIVGVYPDNPHKQSLPTTIGLLVLNDPQTGVPLTIMDASFLGAMCAGAAGGVAVRYLARQQVDDVVVFGSGVRARTQLMAVCTVRAIDGAMVSDPDSRAAHRFADEMSKALSVPVHPAEDVQAAVEMADLIITASRAREPIFRGEWLQAGVHVNAAGHFAPDTRELDSETIERAKVVLDQKSACLAEVGDLAIPIAQGAISEAHFHAELGQVVAGLRPGRESDDEITLFKSVGLAMQEVAAAVKVYRMALERGIGRVVEL